MKSAKKPVLIAAALAAAGGWSRLAGGDTLHIPGDYPTIQAAVDASTDGDVVLVADGVYTGPGNRDIDFGGRSITVRGANGPDQCVIDLSVSEHRGFYFHSGETAAAVVDGLTIRGARPADYYFGGLIFGGGITCEGSSPTIANCMIVDNSVSHNVLFAKGGGIYSSGGSPTVLNCTFIGNTAGSNDGAAAGGGVYCAGGDLTMINCNFAGNSAGSGFQNAWGGGVYAIDGLALLVNCAFSSNASTYGSAVYGDGVTMINCTFSKNTLYPYNWPTYSSGAFHGAGQVTSCIFWDNQMHQIVGSPTVSFSDVQDGWSGPGMNNIDADPLFVDAAGGDLRLRPGSPCIDAGDGTGLPPEVTTDLAGSARYVDDQDAPDCAHAPGQCGGAPVVDMGAYETHLPCPWDLNYSAQVGVDDFEALLLAWGTDPQGPPDFDGDGTVGILDFLLLLAHWGPCCGPADGKQADCDATGFPDECELDAGQSIDCNGNSVPDECDLAGGTSTDCDADTVPDDCQFVDCNRNGIADQCDLADGTSLDCNGDSVPDDCQGLGCLGCNHETAKLIASDAASNDRFGAAVAVGGGVAIIGAPGDDETGFATGSAYVFRFGGTQWLQEAKLLPSYVDVQQAFGRSVAVSGGAAVIGTNVVHAYSSGLGAAYVFRFTGTQWVEEAKLTASDVVPFDGFGAAVSISGGVLVVGAGNGGGSVPNSGAAYVFRFDGAQWVEETKLTASDGAAYDGFGESVSVSGNVAVVGAYGDDDAGPGSGSAYVFTFNGTQWAEEAKLTASEGAADDAFGGSVSVRGDTVVIGATGDDDEDSADPNDAYAGSAYVFRYLGTQWVQEARLTSSDAFADYFFGLSVSLSSDPDIVAVGASPASAYVFLFDGANWVEQARLTASDAAAGDGFGRVSVSGGVAFVGAQFDDDAGPQSGSAYVFRSLSDCNQTGALDLCEILEGASADADGDGTPDECLADCNGNGVPDDEDLAGGASGDCNGNSVPDECELDCNGNGVADSCDVAAADCNGNGLVDECEPDCNGNSVPDDCDIAGGTSEDCDGNGNPDECGTDCNANGLSDDCDIALGPSTDFDGDGVPDECQLHPPNDPCIAAGPIGEGAYAFNTITAFTDGPLVTCDGVFGPIASDVWYLYTPSCTGYATFSVCNDAAFDTRLAVYYAGPCPPGNALACSDNAPGCGQTSEVQAIVVAGFPYLVRIGGHDYPGGPGMLTVSCAPLP